MSDELNIPKDVLEDAMSFWRRVGIFRKDWTMREIRLMKKCQENPQDNEGLIMGAYLVMKRRENPATTLEDVLDTKESVLMAELREKLPADDK